jgi:hypothetical protein
VTRAIQILLQCTIPTTVDDWSIARFSQLGKVLSDARGMSGQPLFEVTLRDRDPHGSPDSVLSTLDRSEFDQLWLFAVDVGNGLTPEDCRGISEFRRNGHGLLVCRDHMDLGSSVCNLAGVGAAHHFHLATSILMRASVMTRIRRRFPGRIITPAQTVITKGSRS